MEILLIAALIYLGTGSLVLLRNHYECTALLTGNEARTYSRPTVSVCIPARDEEQVIGRCVESLMAQNYQDLEILILDDESTDRTAEILSMIPDPQGKLRVIKGKPKPADWLGKPWACNQLSEQATGEYLIFTDADVWLEPDVVQNTVRELHTTDGLTVWPQQILISFWEQLIIPMVYHALFTLLPSIYVERSPRWIPPYLRRHTDSRFSAANGQFLAFRRSVYDNFGGHFAVRDKVVEDVEIASAIKTRGFRFRMLHGAQQVYCRMYTDHSGILNGFRKNFLPGFGHPLLFLLMWIVHIAVYLIPPVILVIASLNGDFATTGLALTVILIPILQRLYLAKKFTWNPGFAFTHHLAVCWFQLLALRVSADRLTGKSVTWKGRSVNTEKKVP